MSSEFLPPNINLDKGTGFASVQAPYGLRIKIIDAGSGAKGCNGFTGIIRSEEEINSNPSKYHKSGILDSEEGFYVEIIDKLFKDIDRIVIWRVKYEGYYALVDTKMNQIDYTGHESIRACLEGVAKDSIFINEEIKEDKEDDRLSATSILNRIAYNIQLLNKAGYRLNAKGNSNFVYDIKLSSLYISKKE